MFLPFTLNLLVLYSRFTLGGGGYGGGEEVVSPHSPLTLPIIKTIDSIMSDDIIGVIPSKNDDIDMLYASPTN